VPVIIPTLISIASFAQETNKQIAHRVALRQESPLTSFFIDTVAKLPFIPTMSILVLILELQLYMRGIDKSLGDVHDKLTLLRKNVGIDIPALLDSIQSTHNQRMDLYNQVCTSSSSWFDIAGWRLKPKWCYSTNLSRFLSETRTLADDTRTAIAPLREAVIDARAYIKLLLLELEAIKRNGTETKQRHAIWRLTQWTMPLVVEIKHGLDVLDKADKEAVRAVFGDEIYKF
jgi:hypothetical protein